MDAGIGISEPKSIKFDQFQRNYIFATDQCNLYTKLRPIESNIRVKFIEADVIQKLKCSSSEKDYIGYTERPSNIRIKEYSLRSSHLNKARLSFNECNVPVSPDPFTVTAPGKIRRDLPIKEAYDHKNNINNYKYYYI